MRFAVPRWSSGSQRPQLFSSLKYPSTRSRAARVQSAIARLASQGGAAVPTLVNPLSPVNPTLDRPATEGDTDAMAVTELERHRYLCLATFRRSGAEVRTPVWFAAADGTLYVFTAGDSGKAKRLRNSPRARIAPCDARGGVLGAWREATARLVTDRALIARAGDALRAKYGWQMTILDLFSRVAGRIERRAWIEIA